MEILLNRQSVFPEPFTSLAYGAGSDFLIENPLNISYSLRLSLSILSVFRWKLYRLAAFKAGDKLK